MLDERGPSGAQSQGKDPTHSTSKARPKARYLPAFNEMRLRLNLTRNQPNAAATMAPLNVAKVVTEGSRRLIIAILASDWQGTARRQLASGRRARSKE